MHRTYVIATNLDVYIRSNFPRMLSNTRKDFNESKTAMKSYLSTLVRKTKSGTVMDKTKLKNENDLIKIIEYSLRTQACNGPAAVCLRMLSNPLLPECRDN